ncbi:sensor histidine kinase [Corynebacterium wankanglinii]|uniref:histidine kinase n=1 Tax=Corynebacterium wankanglinii TaxID=2735136 RepID=A0A838CKU9_9CORY|nr:histidine kinase [Corynebacterium wankanglinii]MBA1835841.1 hypothetical protein [Corynebacterium wankanglinii]
MSSLRVAFPGSRRNLGAAVASIAAATAAVGISLAGAGEETGRLAIAVAMVLTVGTANLAPFSSVLAAASLTQFAASHPGVSSPFVVLALIALASVLAYRLTVWKGLLAGLLLWYLAQTELAAGVWLPNDADTAGLLGVLMLAAAAAGWALRLSDTRRREEAEQLQQRIEDERERAVLALHGSVASSLTSVVLRSEALAMSGDPRVSEVAQLIAHDARRSMQEVRDLIRFMRDDTASPSSEATPSVSVMDTFTALAEELRGHGFYVVESGITSDVVGNVTLASAERVCRELTTNILKYGDTARPVIVAALRGEGGLTIAVQNSISGQQRDTHMSTGIGLEEARALVAAQGATLGWHAEGDSWRYELTLPQTP